MLSAFILGLACGAFAIRRRSDAGAASVRTLALVQIAMGVLAVMTLPVYLQSFHWMADVMSAFSRTTEGYRAFSIARYFICLAVMLPATFCAGTVTTARSMGSGMSATQAYARTPCTDPAAGLTGNTGPVKPPRNRFSSTT